MKNIHGIMRNQKGIKQDTMKSYLFLLFLNGFSPLVIYMHVIEKN